MRLACEGGWDGIIATFAPRRNELYGAGIVFDGKQVMRSCSEAKPYTVSRPSNEIIAIGAREAGDFWLDRFGRRRAPHSG